MQRAVGSWRPLVWARWPALLSALVCLLIAVTSIPAVIGYWPGRTFPGFFLHGNGIVATNGLYSWTGIDRAVPSHAQVMAVDGEAIESSAEVYDRVAARPPGTTFTYTLRKDGAVRDLAIRSMRFGPVDFCLTIGILLAFGLASAFVAIAIGLLEPGTDQARACLVQGTLAAVSALTGAALYQPDMWWLIHPHLVAQATFPAALLHLGFVYPVPRRFIERHRGLLGVPYLVSALLVAWAARDFYHEPPSMAPVDGMYVYVAVAVAGLFGLLAFAFVENRTAEVRRQLHLLLPGLALGVAVGLYGFLATAQRGGDFPTNLIGFTPFIIFLTVGYAVARHDIFDADAVLRNAAAYGALTLGVIALYAGTVAVAEHWRPAIFAERGKLFTIAFVVSIAVFFEPARSRIQRAVDRYFSREQLDYRGTVTTLTTDLARQLDVDAIVDRLGRSVHESLGLHSTAVLVWMEDSCRAMAWGQQAPAPGRLALHHPAMEQLFARRHDGRPWRPGRDGDRDPAAECEAEALGASLVVPIQLGQRVIGALALGRRRSGRSLGHLEVDLLRTLAAQAAVALGNAVSYHALVALNACLEQTVSERTAALTESHREIQRAYDEVRVAEAQLVHSEKMAALGVLVAGVAHEINNPVTFIVGGLDPLKAGIEDLRASAAVEGDPRVVAVLDRMRRAIGAIERGAKRTAAIVRDLRSFSRLGDTSAVVVDLHEDIEVTLRLLHPRWADRIAIHRDYATDLPPLSGAGDELNQVWMNLLANACDAVGAGGNVWVTTTARDGAVVVTVRDDGPGIPPSILPRIFDPFFTTKDQGQGTGLGLAVSHGIVTRHGGRIDVRSEPGGGAEVSVWLPLGGSTPAIHRG